MKTTRRETQTKQVLEYLEKNKSITAYEAFKMGILRLSARIYDLRHEMKVNVKTINQVEGDKVYAKYILG